MAFNPGVKVLTEGRFFVVCYSFNKYKPTCEWHYDTDYFHGRSEAEALKAANARKDELLQGMRMHLAAGMSPEDFDSSVDLEDSGISEMVGSPLFGMF
jgi:hypothetical protein